MNRAVTTLFMLMSLDGKISTGCSDSFDFDTDLPLIDGVNQGLYQYYDIEKTTDLWSFNTGLVQDKVGVNEKDFPEKSIVSYVIVDNNHLKEHGVKYLCSLAKNLVLVTSNDKHPAFSIKADNMEIIKYSELDLEEIFSHIKDKYGCNNITLQSGSTMNGYLLHSNLIDYVDIVVAPILIGGKDVPTLIGGESISSKNDLHKLGILKLQSVDILKNSYVRMRYKVLHKN